MAEDIEITVCTGTTCYVMGGAVLYGLEHVLRERFGGHIVFKGSSCLGLCKSADSGRPPFAVVNGTVISEATPDRIMSAVAESCGDGRHQ